MTPLQILLINHLIGDFLWQWKVKDKYTKWLPLVIHCSIYTTSFIGSFWFLGINLWWLLLLFFSHLIIDKKWFVHWWVKSIKREDLKINSGVTSLVDQIFHLIIIAIITFISFGVITV